MLVRLFVIVLILDFLFIYLCKNIFNRQITIIQNEPIKVKYVSAAICYCVIVFLLYWFIIKHNKSYTDAFLLGCSVYGVYELTNMSLFNKWEYKTVFIDSIWGGVLFGLTTYILNKPIDTSIIHPAYL